MSANKKNSQKIKATLAFVFNQDLSEVLLMEKQRPVFHAGLLNGLGGKLEAQESDLGCVVREIEEEAGVAIPENEWVRVGSLEWDIWQITIWTAKIEKPSSKKFPEEGVGWYPVSPLPENVISNLKWLIPLSIDVIQKIDKDQGPPLVKVKY